EQRAEQRAAGRWLRDGRHFIHIGGVAADGWHAEVRVYELNDEHHLARIIEAGRARATADEWVLADVTLSELRGGEVSITRRERLHLPRAAPGGAGERDVSELNPAAMNVFQLFDYVEFLRASKLSGARAELALWTRFSAALSIIVMLLLAMPWIFFSARSAGSGKRLFFAILISLAYMIGSRVIGDAAVVWQMPPVVGAFLPVALFAAAGAVLLKRLQAG
ncbi:MAG: LptF/LptG family permease, partial [Gammaproteobacteria bacterium]|nr:LptF/LptG family permease [Gammaproteobacteria bacterium]